MKINTYQASYTNLLKNTINNQMTFIKMFNKSLNWKKIKVIKTSNSFLQKTNKKIYENKFKIYKNSNVFKARNNKKKKENIKNKLKKFFSKLIIVIL